MKGNLSYYGATDTGLVRKNNEDTFSISQVWDGNYLLLVVVDGCGGYEGGEVASAIARDAIVEYLTGFNKDASRLSLLEEAVCVANNKIVRRRAERKKLSSMGCVLTAAVIDKANGLLLLSHVGDTRCYLYSGGTLRKLTRDHSLVGELEDTGAMTEKEAMNHPRRSIIDRMVGEEYHRLDDGFVDSTIIPLPDDYSLLLCSDGLTDMVSSSEIKAILNTVYSTEEKTKCLIEYANKKGGKDNITIVIAETISTE